MTKEPCRAPLQASSITEDAHQQGIITASANPRFRVATSALLVHDYHAPPYALLWERLGFGLASAIFSSPSLKLDADALLMGSRFGTVRGCFRRRDAPARSKASQLAAPHQDT